MEVSVISRITYKNEYISTNDMYLILRNEILNLTLKPGQLLSENDIAKRFNVSRTPVRSVVERLKNESLITTDQRKGNYVSFIDIETVVQVIYIRSRVETDVLKMAARKEDQFLIKELELNLDEQKKQIKDNIDPEKFFEIDNKFHKLSFKAVGKQKAWDILQQLLIHYSRYRMLDFSQTRDFEMLYQQHADMYTAVINKDYPKIEQATINHLCGGMVRLQNRLGSDSLSNYFEENNFSLDDIITQLNLIKDV